MIENIYVFFFQLVLSFLVGVAGFLFSKGMSGLRQIRTIRKLENIEAELLVRIESLKNLEKLIDQRILEKRYSALLTADVIVPKKKKVKAETSS